MYQVVDTLTPKEGEVMESLQSQFGSFAIAAFIVYFVLRALGPQKNRVLIERARQHALWCAIIGYFASSSTAWFGDAMEIPYSDPGKLDPVASVAVAATPALWVCFIYIAGQYTWPRSLKPQRTATLAPRSLTSPIPKTLLAILSAVFVTACLAAYSVRDVAAISPLPAVEYSTEDSSWSNPEQSGLRPATDGLPYLYLDLSLLIVATAVVTFVILRRKPLPGISEHDNRLLRTTWLNRLYRTVIFLLATHGAEAIHYKARWFHIVSTDELDGLGAGIDYMDKMSGIGGNLDTVANLAVVGISALMLFWAPPSNFENLHKPAFIPFTRMRDQLLSLQFTSAVLTILAICIAWPYLPNEDELTIPTGERETWILVIFAGAALFYLALNVSYLSYVNRVSRRVATAPKHSAPLPKWSYICAGILVAACTYYLLFPPLNYLWGFTAPYKTVVLGLVLLLFLAHLGFVWFVRGTIIPWETSPSEDIWYRRVLEIRSMRTVTSAVVAMLVVGYEFPARLDLLALLIFVMPAIIFLKHPHNGSALPRASMVSK